MTTTSLLRNSNVLEALCKATGKWGIYVAVCLPPEVDDPTTDDGLLEAAPWLTREQVEALITTGCGDYDGYVLFESEADMLGAFRSTVGDEGPTAENPYDGPVRVYAMTCDPTGQLRNENT